jgi:hypothetical protein
MYRIIKRKFKIEKLYLDCIDDSGNCFIIYRAKLDFSFLSIFYSGLIFSDSSGFTYEKSTFRKSERPLINDSLYMNLKTFKINGSWERSDAPIAISLYKDNQNHELIWNCHHPKSRTEIKYNGKIYKGFGYAESLSLTIKPWNLPIDELRWGRFLSDTCTIIWINWVGKYPVNRIFLNGVEYNDAIFKDGIISFSDEIYQLKFSEILTIREGKLLNLFPAISFLKLLFNRRILDTVEIKYKAKTIFSKNGVRLSKGWSLYEIVTWAK